MKMYLHAFFIFYLITQKEPQLLQINVFSLFNFPISNTNKYPVFTHQYKKVSNFIKLL